MKRKICICAMAFSLWALICFAQNNKNEASFSGGSKINPNVELRVFKGERTMELWSEGKRFKTYPISLGAQPIGHKQMEGDEKTPEGEYSIISKNNHSRYHLSLKISYPRDEDRQNANKKGLNPGGDIMIHGLPNGFGFIGKLHTWWNWTDGCIAVTNKEIEEIWHLVPLGTKVFINP